MLHNYRGLHINPMFGLREGNGREEKKNRGEGKNVSQSDKFFITFISLSLSLSLSHAIQTVEKI